MKSSKLPYLGLGFMTLVIAGIVSSSLNPLPQLISAKPEPTIPKTIVRGLEHPWSMAWLPDGSILITERPGRLRIVKNGVLLPQAIAGLPNIYAQGQGGLMDISLHPQFQQNRLVYLTYAHGDASANRTRLGRAKFDGKSLTNFQVIFEAAPVKAGTQHFGSRIAWLQDGTLLLAIGDGGNPPLKLGGSLIREQAQKLNSHLGKVLRLNDDGSAPKNNPFIKKPQAKPEIWSYGHRNIQGLAVDQNTGKVWATEHGSKGGDELNLLNVGKNYGWPQVSFSQEYFGGDITSLRSKVGMVDPKLVWTPAIAPSGLAVYNSTRFPQWQGNLFLGGLVSQDLRRITIDRDGLVKTQEQINIGQRVRDVRQGADGFIYVLTDQVNGELIRLQPAKTVNSRVL
jgi:glucose/arabinose dehydrogenase